MDHPGPRTETAAAPENSRREDFAELMNSAESSEAMQHDGVRADTVRILKER